MKKNFLLIATAFLLLSSFAIYSQVINNPAPPASPVKLIFLHHSTGQNWLNDQHGGLGISLRDNNYYVSDTNYGWGPDAIGDKTDIGQYWLWFQGPNADDIMNNVYAENGQYCNYSRIATEPTGANTIVMFKSCFPNSALQGSTTDPIPNINDNQLRTESAGSEAHTIANAKGIYVDILKYFRSHQDKMFVLITAPPLSDATYSGNARALNQWLMTEWLKDYTFKNVFVFDFYNVLTTNGGTSEQSDLDSETGNHHRWHNNQIQHLYDGVSNTLKYASSDGDDHPNEIGSQKATNEYLPLLNISYNNWKGTNSSVNESNQSEHLLVYPNPVKEFLYINAFSNQEQKAEIKIYNQIGSLIKSINITMNDSGCQLNKIDVNDLQSGVYYIVYRNGSQLEQQYFIKQ